MRSVFALARRLGSATVRSSWRWLALAACAAGCLVATASAATSANAQSAIGMNLNGVTYYTAEQPFLNIFKTTGVAAGSTTGWVTSSDNVYDTGEEGYLQLDSNGYPTTLTASSADPHKPQQFNHLSILLLFNLANSNGGSGPPYRAGQYVVLYDGQGTLAYSGDAKLVTSSPGRDVINVATPTYGGGIGINLIATASGNYLRNIRVVYAAEESMLAANNIFRPAFLASLQAFRVLRFMDWLDTNNSSVTSWSSRPLMSDGGWGSTRGVPLEVAIQLCNAVGADCWLNVPHQADDNYVSQMATLVHSSLGSNQNVYLEFSNEVWNGQFQQSAYATSKGKALWPNAGVSDFEFNRSWYGMRTAQMCDQWKSVWGSDFSRVHCVLGAQAANAWSATNSLDCPLWTGAGNAPCAQHNISEAAIAPYFGFQAPSSWSGLSQAAQLNNLFTELNQGGLIAGDYPGGYLKQVADWEAAVAKALVPYHIPMVSYEGGQTFQAFPTYGNGSWAANLYIAANKDARMGTAYLKALSDWKNNGGHVYMQFVDASTPSQYGEWGALASFMDTITPLSSAPAKWQALQNFISSNPCWWTGCAGSVGGAGSNQVSVPNPPSNLAVH